MLQKKKYHHSNTHPHTFTPPLHHISLFIMMRLALLAGVLNGGLALERGMTCESALRVETNTVTETYLGARQRRRGFLALIVGSHKVFNGQYQVLSPQSSTCSTGLQ